MSIYDKLTSGVYVIAEMSANHGGSLDNALEIVRAAKKAGADCLKIQTYTADTLTLDCNNEYFTIKQGLWKGYRFYDLYKEAFTPWEWHKAIKDECEKNGIDFLSTPFDRTSVDFLEQLGVQFYKIASFELVDIPLIQYAASKGKPMVMSCGMASPQEIADAVAACKSSGNERIILLKCCSEYPASYSDMNLSVIGDMKKRFKLPVGLSDHSLGSAAAVTAVALGACVIEKHFRLDKEVKSADSDFSMSASSFASMVTDIRNAHMAIGKPIYSLTESEKASTVFRRSVFASRDINENEDFTAENIRCVRPGYGEKPVFYNEIIGKKAKRAIRFGNPVFAADAEGFLALRRACERDVDLLFAWTNDPLVRENSFNSEPVKYESHVKWYNNTLNSADSFIYIITNGQSDLGLIRYKIEKDVATLGYSVDKNYRGHGYGKELLTLGTKALKLDCPAVNTIIAEVKPENKASVSAVEKSGFTLISKEEDRLIYKYEI